MGNRVWSPWGGVEAAARTRARESGVDGRTNYFAGNLLQDSSLAKISRRYRMTPWRARRLLVDYVSPRLQPYPERTKERAGRAVRRSTILLSQGYRQGLHWRGVPLGKTCFDICIYQMMVAEIRPATIIELGTGLGGSSLMLADQCSAFGLETQILTIDRNARHVDQRVTADPGVEFIHGNVGDLDSVLPDERLSKLAHPWLVIEDSHRHVESIVGHLYPHLVDGDYLVIEDMRNSSAGAREVDQALSGVPDGALMVDTYFTDLFGRNVTSSPDSILRRCG